MALEAAIGELRGAISTDNTAAGWRWSVRQRLSAVREALREEAFWSRDGWLAARSASGDRERTQLLRRLTLAGTGLLDRRDLDRVSAELDRLANDLDHYGQRMHDLVYDSVALELGGSE